MNDDTMNDGTILDATMTGDPMTVTASSMNTRADTMTERANPLTRHHLDLVALCFGTVFLAIGAARLGDLLGWVHVNARSWLGTAMVTIGLIAIVAVVAQGVRRRT